MQAWPALAAARAHDPATRVPFAVDIDASMVEAGSVARDHARALHRWPQWVQAGDHRVTLVAPPAERTDALMEINHALRARPR
jgi:hypothetical protein